MSATPTVEEILNEYHRKAFEAQAQGKTDTASTWSRRSGTAKTLEQETVDTLTAAGYEAYNVTADNYNALEAELQTDFAGMGLDPDGSYIVVISGEDPAQSAPTGGVSPCDVSPLPEEDEAPEGGSAYFNYTYNGTTYCMRYVTFTSASEVTNLVASSIYTLEPSSWLEDFALSFWDTLFITAIDAGATAVAKFPMPLGTALSMFFGAQIDENYIDLEPGTLTVHASTTWTVHAIQIWDDVEEEWKTAQASASATSKAKCAGYAYDPTTHTSNWYEGVEATNTRYSPEYGNLSQQKVEAVLAFREGTVAYDETGDVGFYLGNSAGEIMYNGEDSTLFTHAEQWRVVQ